MQFLFWQPIEIKQPDDARHLDFKVDRAEPIFVGLFFFGPQYAEFTPQFKGIGGKLAFLEMDDFGQLAAKQAEGSPHVDDVNGHVKPIQHENAAR